MYLETCKVSRKTPGDGKLQITATTYKSLAGAGEKLSVTLQEHSAAAGLATLECTCNKGPEHQRQSEAATVGAAPHRHFFLESPLLRTLSPDATVRLDLDGVQLAVAVTPL